jgi:hypothetical protein
MESSPDMSEPSWWQPPWDEGSEQDPDTGWRAPDADAWDSAENVHFGDEAILEPMEAQFGQIRCRERVRDLAEVFTHQREVDAMLDMVPDAFVEVDVKFLEPACGSGNFLAEILKRKLLLVRKSECVSQEQYEHLLLRAAASVYGVDISTDNVIESRARLAHVLLTHFQTDANTIQPSVGFLNAAATIIGDNIVQGDSLNAADQIELCDWQPHSGGRFRRVWSCALVPAHERNLFWEERVEDKEPVHYSEIAKPAGSKAPRSKQGGAK